MKTKTRVILSTLIALLLLMAAVAAGLNAVFTVTYVRAEFVTFSEQGDREAEELRVKLEKFVGKSTTFLKLGAVRETVGEYPHFTVRSVSKKFPSTVCLSVIERKEAYAYRTADGKYTILDEDGRFLTGDNKTYANREAGMNILLGGFSLSVSETEEVSGSYFNELLIAASAFRSRLSDIRANLVSVTLNPGTTDGRNISFLIETAEGVEIEIRDPSEKIGEKAALAADHYLALSDEQRMYGWLTAYETDAGELRTRYTQDFSLEN